MMILPLAAALTISEAGGRYILSNGAVTATVDQRTGDLASLKYRGLELMGHGSGHAAGYWEQDPSRAPRLTHRITLDPAANGGVRAEVSILGVTGGETMLTPDAPGGGTTCDLEIRYSLGRDDSGVYAYAIFSHPAAYPDAQIGESRFGAKLNPAVFDWLSVTPAINRLMPAPSDWAHGIQLNMKEARRLTTGRYAGQVEHKYDYSAPLYDAPAFGWSGTQSHVGFWFINPSMEYLGGGPTKVELTGHLDLTPVADPTLLDYWRGTHYGGTTCAIPAGEGWSKVVGPIFLYCNSGPDPLAMYRDALRQAQVESERWPYGWVRGVDYTPAPERARVAGSIRLDDPQAATPASPFRNLWVGLAAEGADWQRDAKHYEFWARGDSTGAFEIPHVRPGRYTLHAFADGVLGEFSAGPVVVDPSSRIELKGLVWRPVRFGRQVWEIGVPNRSAREFAHGDDYAHWGLYLQYPRWFPHDVHYVVGESDYRKDWNFEQVPRVEHDDGTGRTRGEPTTWSIEFNLPQAPHGRAILRIALVGVGTSGLGVYMNGRPAGALTGLRRYYNAVLNRDGIQGSWMEKDVEFDASLMKAGKNLMQLTIPGGAPFSGLMYDYLRLELAEK